MTKKVLSIFTVILLMTVMAIPTMAAETPVEHLHIDNCCEEMTSNSDIGPQYLGTCPAGSRHQMRGAGVGRIYSGSMQNPGVELLYGFAFQCRNCNWVLVSEGSPKISGILGRYSLTDWPYQIGANTIVFGGFTGSFYGNLGTDPFWAGFQF